jgi:hypothetical protein
VPGEIEESGCVLTSPLARGAKGFVGVGNNSPGRSRPLAPGTRRRHVAPKLRAIDSKRERPAAFEDLVNLEGATIQDDPGCTRNVSLHGQRE